jgi:hypothetical protein
MFLFWLTASSEMPSCVTCWWHVNVSSDTVLIPTLSPFLDSAKFENKRCTTVREKWWSGEIIRWLGQLEVQTNILVSSLIYCTRKMIRRILKGNGWGTRDGEGVVKEIVEEEHRGRAKTVCE